MSKYESFTACDVHCIPVINAQGDTISGLGLRRVFWLNPPGKSSSQVEVSVPLLADDNLRFENRSLVVGWKCLKCNRILFGTCIEDLLHAPCCGMEE